MATKTQLPQQPAPWAKQLMDIMEEHGLTQSDVEGFTGIRVSQLSRYLNGHIHGLWGKNLSRMARLFRCSPDDFLSGNFSIPPALEEVSKSKRANQQPKAAKVSHHREGAIAQPSEILTDEAVIAMFRGLLQTEERASVVNHVLERYLSIARNIHSKSE
jgi:transcriptional regulator with XRE-family HTH domain